jgi:voltage-gated potassium channel
MNRQVKDYDTRMGHKPGDKIVHIHRKKKRRLRVSHDVPGLIKFLQDMASQTPLLPSLAILVALWLLLSWGLYACEHQVSDQLNSFGECLWWSFTAMQTQGANIPGPITPLGRLVGSIWSIVGTIGFFGVIIATLYAYFMSPKRRPLRAVIANLKYNLEEFENLSIDELEILKDTISKITDARIKELRQRIPADK